MTLACGCAEKFITEVSVGVSLDDALSVGCPCCGRPSGQPCGLAGRAPNEVRYGDVCPVRVHAFTTVHVEQLQLGAV